MAMYVLAVAGRAAVQYKVNTAALGPIMTSLVKSSMNMSACQAVFTLCQKHTRTV